MTAAAARKVYEQADIGPDDLDVIELHGLLSPNELLTYEALGLCGEGEDTSWSTRGHHLRRALGGQPVRRPDLKGHPLGATGLAQCAELTWQLRGEAAARQVGDAKSHSPTHRPRRRGIVTAYRLARLSA